MPAAGSGMVRAGSGFENLGFFQVDFLSFGPDIGAAFGAFIEFRLFGLILFLATWTRNLDLLAHDLSSSANARNGITS